MAEEKNNTEEEEKGSSKLMIIIIAVVVLIAIGVGAMMFLGGDDKSEATAEAADAKPKKEAPIYHVVEAPFNVNFGTQSDAFSILNGCLQVVQMLSRRADTGVHLYN